MEHGGELNAKLARGMNGDTKLECFADTGGFDTRADAAPEGRIKKNYIDSGVENVGRELFEVHDNGVGGERDAHFFTRPAHPVHSIYRVFEVVVIQIFNTLAKADGFFRRHDAVWIEANAIVRKGQRQCAIKLQFMPGREDTGFQFVSSEAVFALHLSCEGDQLVGGAYFSSAGGSVGVTKEAIGCERYAI